jgi:hypothetical protein
MRAIDTLPLFTPASTFEGFLNPQARAWIDLGKVLNYDGMRTSQSPFWKKFFSAMDNNQELSTHKILDEILTLARPGAENGKHLVAMIKHLRERVPDAPVIPQPTTDIRTKNGELYRNSGGLYDPRDGKIYLAMNSPSARLVRDLVHEMIHAATADFIIHNPDHPEVQKLLAELTVARQSIAHMFDHLRKTGEISKLSSLISNWGADKLSIKSGITPQDDAKEQIYGLRNVVEFAAEAKTNPQFQELLAKSSVFTQVWSRVRQAVNGLYQRMAEMLGIKKPEEAQQFIHIMESVDKIMDLQKQAMETGKLQRHATAAPMPSELHKAVATTTAKTVAITTGRIARYTEEILRAINPEGLGDKARLAAAIVARHMAEEARANTDHYTNAETRRRFWEANKGTVFSFIDFYERGAKFKNPEFQAIAEHYRKWNSDIAAQDKVSGFKYKEQDHYFAHLWDEGDRERAMEWLKGKHTKWADPGFIKDRTFDLYQEGIKAGFKPRYSNPEDIMLARQHASDVAQMQVNVLNHFVESGLAKPARKIVDGKKVRLRPPGYPATRWRSPNGDIFWVNNQAYAILHNAFDTKGLWEMKGMLGDAFRGAMFLKNTLVPIKLAFSLFHPLHVATIDNATGMVRASKLMLSGRMSPAKWLAEMGKSAFYLDFVSNFKSGSTLMKIYRGEKNLITREDAQNLLWLYEGGVNPVMSREFRTGALQRYRDAIDAHSAKAIFHAPFALLDKVQGIIFDHWIPSLKVASYLKDVRTALAADPTLLKDNNRRLEAFRKLGKSVDNRYGEMAYKNLFWNKMLKDVAVMNTLSLGWQMGFIREYGGGILDIGQGKGSVAERASKGMLDRPMFILAYSAQALIYGGLLTWAMTGQAPQDFVDYIYPKTGNKTADGKDERASTMFYPKEFYAIAKHMENEGVAKGIQDTILSKATGLIGLATSALRGVNEFGDQIRDPDAPVYRQLEQTLEFVLKEMLPISVTSVNKEPGSSFVDRLEKNPGPAARSFLGFANAPKYITDSQTEGRIKSIYQSQYAPKETPFNRAQFGEDTRAAKQAYLTNDPKFDSMMDAIISKYDPDGRDPQLERRLVRAWEREDERGGAANPTLKMFQRFDWTIQKRLLDSMPPADREKYLPYSNKKYLRDNYEPPK